MSDALTAGWHEFYVALAGAAAALAGLVMVAISVNIKEIIAGPTLPARAGAAVGSLVLIVVIAAVGLIPGQTSTALGIEILLGTLVASALHLMSLRHVVRVGASSRANRIARIPLTLAQLLPLLIGSALLIAGAPVGLGWIAAGMLLTIIGSMLDAWVLMVEIRR
ncbi:hypothetical protein AB4Y63_00015 [Leifsonia sp. YAF41]|uniref:hypothetical protein n=1 Tax=Leifsonia sp. YAF41 TaxID=3233086 RepID=UPI003F969A37